MKLLFPTLFLFFFVSFNVMAQDTADLALADTGINEKTEKLVLKTKSTTTEKVVVLENKKVQRRTVKLINHRVLIDKRKQLASRY